MGMNEEKSLEKSILESKHCSTAQDSDDSSITFSDADDHSLNSPLNENSHCAGTSFDEFQCFEIDKDGETCWRSDGSECSVAVDMECVVAETRIDLSEAAEKDCRICHLGLVSGAAESGVAIELGCSCKDDLASAHKQCAETWFKIRGNKTCEICGSTARNVVGTTETEYFEQFNETVISTAPGAEANETRSFWQGHRFLNFLLACMVFAFVISWLFHFNVPG